MFRAIRSRCCARMERLEIHMTEAVLVSPQMLGGPTCWNDAWASQKSQNSTNAWSRNSKSRPTNTDRSFLIPKLNFGLLAPNRWVPYFAIEDISGGAERN